MNYPDILNSKYPFELPPLPYAYDALEPYVDEETVYYHHDKHFQTYINNLNAALEPYQALRNMTLQQLLRRPLNLQPKQRTAILNNAGGVYNHAVYFNGMAPENKGKGRHYPSERLLSLIVRTFGTFERFRDTFNQQALSVFGSGYTCLAMSNMNTLRIVNPANQNTVIPNNMRPLVLFDVWEHAYYLKYKNLRKDYVENLWNVIVFPDI